MQLALKRQVASIMAIYQHTLDVFFLQRQFSSKKKHSCDYIWTNWVVNKFISNELADYSQILICLLLNVTKHHVHPVKIPVVSILDKYGWSVSRACRRKNIWMPVQYFTVEKTWVLKKQNLILIRRCSIFIKNIQNFGIKGQTGNVLGSGYFSTSFFNVRPNGKILLSHTVHLYHFPHMHVWGSEKRELLTLITPKWRLGKKIITCKHRKTKTG